MEILLWSQIVCISLIKLHVSDLKMIRSFIFLLLLAKSLQFDLLQSAQTNGDRNFNRKLTKSYSELCQSVEKTRRLLDGNENDQIEKHEPLLRSQSEEPPK